MTTPMTNFNNETNNHENFNEGFIFYQSFDQMINSMPDEKLQLETYKLISKYALYGQEPQTDNWLLRALFSVIKPQIDANNKRRTNGKKGGRKAAQETAVPEPEAAEAASQPASTAPAAAPTEAKAAATEPNMEALVNQLASQVLAAVQAATQTAPAAQAQPAMQAEPVMQAEPAIQEKPAVQAEPIIQTEAARQAQSAVQVEPIMQTEAVRQAPPAAVPPQPTVQAQPAVQAKPVLQVVPARQAQSAVQTEPVVPAAPVMQAQTAAGEPVKPTPRVQTAPQDDSLGPADRIVYFGENKYPTTPAELGRFEAFAYKLFEKYHGGKPNLADMERVLERTHTRVVRPDGEAIAVFDRGKADLLDYAFEQAKGADKLNWKYVDGMYRNFLVRNIETGAEARQYDLERAHRNM